MSFLVGACIGFTIFSLLPHKVLDKAVQYNPPTSEFRHNAYMEVRGTILAYAPIVSFCAAVVSVVWIASRLPIIDGLPSPRTTDACFNGALSEYTASHLVQIALAVCMYCSVWRLAHTVVHAHTQDQPWQVPRSTVFLLGITPWIYLSFVCASHALRWLGMC